MHELFYKYIRWSQSRSRAKVTASAPAGKYPGSGWLRLRNPGLNTTSMETMHRKQVGNNDKLQTTLRISKETRASEVDIVFKKYDVKN